MLTNGSEPRAQAKIRNELRQNPELVSIVEIFELAPERFQVAADAAGLELSPLDAETNAPGRCRMKLFRPREGRERLCAFFYKRSNLAWSRDRFSYGGVEFRPGQWNETDARGWLLWLTSGFAPELRPERLRRALPYDVPD
jgi:hypothetical protein